MGPQENAAYRLGSISALAIAGLYVIITSLYVVVGQVPTGATQLLEYLAPDTNVWWAIVILSAITDLLYLPVALALFQRLRGSSDRLLMVGVGLLAVFAIIDLAVTQMNFATMIDLSVKYGSATGVEQTTLLAAATYSAAVIDSFLLGAYVMIVPGMGVLAVSAAMRKAGLGRVSAWIGIAAGLAATAAVIGPLFVDALAQLTIPAALLSTIWFVPVGRLLWHGATRPAASANRLRIEAAAPAQS